MGLRPAKLHEEWWSRRQEGVQQNNRLYNPLAVMGLMGYRRLHGNASMERAVVNAAPVFGRRALFVDGTSLRAPHRPGFRALFRPCKAAVL